MTRTPLLGTASPASGKAGVGSNGPGRDGRPRPDSDINQLLGNSFRHLGNTVLLEPASSMFLNGLSQRRVPDRADEKSAPRHPLPIAWMPGGWMPGGAQSPNKKAGLFSPRREHFASMVVA